MEQHVETQRKRGGLEGMMEVVMLRRGPWGSHDGVGTLGKLCGW